MIKCGPLTRIVYTVLLANPCIFSVQTMLLISFRLILFCRIWCSFCYSIGLPWFLQWNPPPHPTPPTSPPKRVNSEQDDEFITKRGNGWKESVGICVSCSSQCQTKWLVKSSALLAIPWLPPPPPRRTRKRKVRVDNKFSSTYLNIELIGVLTLNPNDKLIN